MRYRVSDVQYISFADISVNTPITSPNSTALTSMKSYINSGHVLTCVTDTITWVVQNLSNQYNTTLNGQYVCTMLDESIHTGNNGHALSIVGYDDNIQCDIDGDGTIQEYEKGAFKIADSSGVNVWNQGYIWVMYDALNKESNADLGDSVRHGNIIINYSYYVIEVEEKPLDLTAEITMSCSVKSSINLQLELSPITETIAQEYSSTMFNYNGAKLNFSGSGKTEEESTFVFDFGNLCSSPVGWKNYYLCIRNNNGSYSATIKNIKLIDKTGKTVLNDTEDKALLNSSGDYRYCIAMVGDIDNDGVVSTNDGTLIQQHLARYITLTDEQLTVADVDGDGIVNIFDKTDIERYLLGLSEEFSNGEYVYIE